MTPDDPRHGTNAGYYIGCRDQCCRDAHAAYRRSVWRKRYARRVERLYIDATGTQRRIRALVALGWTFREINARAGWSTKSHGGHAYNILNQGKVHVDTAALVAAIYEDLSMSPPPPGPYRERGRREARRKGWPPPLAWGDIDDPHAKPVGVRKVERTLTRSNDLREEFEFLVAAGVGREQAARQLGVTLKAIERAYDRAKESAA